MRHACSSQAGGHRVIRRHRFFIASAVSLLLCAATAYVAWVPDPFYRDPPPIRTLKRNRKSIMQYLDSIRAGRVPLRSDGKGYFVLDSFGDDVNRVESKDGCIVITFWFMPTDAIPQLVYSPSGFDGLPPLYKHADLSDSAHNNADGLTYFHREQVDGKWFYCVWDN
jgi:hypothetical protein